MDESRLDAVAAPGLREALHYVRSRSSPVTADDLAAARKIHRNVARARLERLAGAGLLVTFFERRTGRTGPGAGRPAKLYAAAPELEAIEFPERRLGALVALLSQGLPQRRLRRAGEAFGRVLAAEAGLEGVSDLRSGLEGVCAAVGRLGFQASVAEAGEERAVLTTPTCPLRPLIVAHPEAVEIDAGMWAGLVEQAVEGVRAERVECETADCFDGHSSCRVMLEFSKTRNVV